MKLIAKVIFLLIFSLQTVSAQSKAELNFKMLEAAKNDQADSVKYWIEKGANVNYVDELYFSALHYAIFNKEYLSRCSNVNRLQIKDAFDYFSLWPMAILLPNYWKGGLLTSKVLIKSGINVNYAKCGYSPLMLACSKGDLRVCKLLIDNGAKTNLLDAEGNDAIIYAQSNGDIRVMNFLLDQQSYSELPTYYEILLKMDSSILENNFTTALELGKLALLKANNELKADHNDFEMIKMRLIAINEQLRQFDEAQNIQKKITRGELSETKEKVAGMIQYPGYALMLGKMAEIAMNDGDFLKAEIVINGIIEYSTKYEIKESDYFTYLLWLSHIYIVLEEFDKSEAILNELLTKNSENKSYKKELDRLIYIELSQLNIGIGNFKKAKQYAQRALDEMFSEDNMDRSVVLALIGQAYFIENNVEKALECFKESMGIAETYKDSYFLGYCAAKNNLGKYYLLTNDLQYAEGIFKELKQELESKNIFNQNYSICMENLAIISIKQNDLLRAKYYSEAAQKIRNDQDSSRLTDLNLLASIQFRINNYREADSLYHLSAIWIEKSLNEKFLYLSENDRNFFAYKKNKDIDEFQSFSLNYYPIEQSIAGFSYNNELVRKGMLLNASQNIRYTINNSNDTTLINTWIKLKEIRNRINFIESQSKPKLLDIADLEEESNHLDKMLTQKSQAYRRIESEQQIRWQDVQSKLKDGEAAIEFSSFQYYNKQWTDSTIYCAIILKKGMGYPLMVPLFEQKQLDSLFLGGNTIPNSLYATRGVTAYYGDQLPNGHKLYNLIWKPLEKELQNVKTVFYAPSGSLHQVAFSALPIDTAYFLCDQYNLVQLSSTRQLATSVWQTKPVYIISTALFGGIKYDLGNPEIAELQRTIPKRDLTLSRGFISDSTLRSASFGYLKGTNDEVEAISTTLRSKKIKTELYTGINGNEEAFKSLSNQNISVLHIATHGFFYPDEKEKPQDLDRLMLMGEQKFRYVSNPLRRSGLILAGGNRTWNGEQPIAGMEDGILTAQEISEMNLQNTELVVLSACETGLGDIKGGEGVFGLQRAFKIAGVKTIIMSLWKVPDGSTSEMMQLFYSKWLGGMDKQEAFRETQREMRNRYPKTPKDWAGFVMLD